MEQHGGDSNNRFVVVQRKDGKVTDVWWHEKAGRLYTFVEACTLAEEDNTHDDGYTSTAAEVTDA